MEPRRSGGGRGLALPPRAGGTHHGPTAAVDFTEQHGEEVTCEAALRLGRRTLGAAVTLWVWAAPHRVRVLAPRTVLAAGDNLAVTCRAEGNPPPRFRRELPTDAGAEPRDGGSAVAVPAARRARSAYRCLAENRYGAGVFRDRGTDGRTERPETPTRCSRRARSDPPRGSRTDPSRCSQRARLDLPRGS
ncbi:uncharacterized protein LOC142365311 isoform X2 [Opisthocomus hoazin]|uniref:uncharacterized protein LOC142365311 isoform X2 n=1 Tax=Opisthocomus hoazin TaxID=30419 RepID=UPI003F538CE0